MLAVGLVNCLWHQSACALLKAFPDNSPKAWGNAGNSYMQKEAVARPIPWNGESLLSLRVYRRIAEHTELWTTCIPHTSYEPWNMCLQIGRSNYIPI